MNLINYLHAKSKQAGHSLSMNELREFIRKDFIQQEQMTDELKSLYRKTYQFEDMQKVLKEKI